MVGRDDLDGRPLGLGGGLERLDAPSAGAPSLTRTPSLRPAKDSGPLARMLSVGDGVEVEVGRRPPALACVGQRGMPRPSAMRGGEVLVDVAQVGDHPLADVGPLDLGELEGEGVDDVLLLDRAAGSGRRATAWL